MHHSIVSGLQGLNDVESLMLDSESINRRRALEIHGTIFLMRWEIKRKTQEQPFIRRYLAMDFY